MENESGSRRDKGNGSHLKVTITDKEGLSDPVHFEQEGPGGPHFEWKSYVDLLVKARRDLANLRKAISSDGLFNFLATLAHVYDWVIQDAAATQGLIDEASQLVFADPPSSVAVVYRLCNKAKHMTLTRSKQPPPTRVRREGWGTQAWGTSPWGGGVTYQAEVNGALIDVLNIGDEALAEWEGLLVRHGLDTSRTGWQP